MLDCIEAFHRHGYVHRDVKASNFALSRVDKPTRPQRYYIIDFGLSRQHLDENKKVIPARSSAEFRGTSMYASLSSHRRQELGPKDDLWSWFYLVMDFMRGELPWAADAQLKNRAVVLGLKEYYTEQKPGLLVEGLQGAPHLLEMMKYLQSLKYEDFPDYKRLGSLLQKVLSDSSEEDENEQDQQQQVQEDSEQVDAAKVAAECDTLESDRERAVLWAQKAHEALDAAVSQSVIDGLLEVRCGCLRQASLNDCRGRPAHLAFASKSHRSQSNTIPFSACRMWSLPTGYESKRLYSSSSKRSARRRTCLRRLRSRAS